MILIRGVLTGAILTACSPGDQAVEQPQANQKPVSAEIQEMATVPKTARRVYGYLADGSEVVEVKLANANGMEVDIISYGGIIVRLTAPDSTGQFGDVVLGLDTLEKYVSSNPYFGALIGRYGNRIASGKFSLDGDTYQLDINDGENHLHGGSEGFDKKNWSVEPFETADSAGVVMKLSSPDGDQGYPGTLRAKVTYELTNDNDLEIRLSATTDRPTIVNLTGHSYFNLAGGGDILNHQLMIPADMFTPVRPGLIPKAIGLEISAEDEQLELGLGYDHNWALKREADDELVLAARVTEPTSGRVLEIFSVEPGLQFYSGNFLDGTLEGKGKVHNYRTGFCLEPQHFPDSPNQQDFPSTALLPHETYETRMVYRFSTVR
jgi:aldose 1-epimerase